MIIGLVAMYMPQKKEIDNISKYISQLDYCYLLDDSAKDNSKAVDSLIKKFPEKVEYHMNVQNIGLVRSVNNGFKLAIEKAPAIRSPPFHNSHNKWPTALLSLRRSHTFPSTSNGSSHQTITSRKHLIHPYNVRRSDDKLCNPSAT